MSGQSVTPGSSSRCGRSAATKRPAVWPLPRPCSKGANRAPCPGAAGQAGHRAGPRAEATPGPPRRAIAPAAQHVAGVVDRQVHPRKTDADGVEHRRDQHRPAPARGPEDDGERHGEAGGAHRVAARERPAARRLPTTSGLGRATTTFMMPLAAMLASVAVATKIACRFSRAPSSRPSVTQSSMDTTSQLPKALITCTAPDGPGGARPSAGSTCPRRACRAPRCVSTAKSASGVATSRPSAHHQRDRRAGSPRSRWCPAAAAATAQASSTVAISQPHATMASDGSRPAAGVVGRGQSRPAMVAAAR